MMPKQSSTTSAREETVGESALGEQGDPGAAVRAAEFNYGVSPQPTVRGDLLDRRLGLVLQCLRLHAARFVGDGVVVGQLRQAAGVAHVHRQRMRRLFRAHGVRSEREVVGRRYLSEVQHSAQIGFLRIPGTRS